MTITHLRLACAIVALLTWFMMADGFNACMNGYWLGVVNIVVGVLIHIFLFYVCCPQVKFFRSSGKKTKK